MLAAIARYGGAGAEPTFNGFAALAATYPFEEPAKPSAGQFGLLVREPVGVVGAIIPWNAPMTPDQQQGRARRCSPGAP